MGGAINHEAVEFHKKIYILVMKWRQENHGRMPKYLFLSNDAYSLLVDRLDVYKMIEIKTYMGIEIAPVGVQGIYAAIGEEF